MNIHFENKELFLSLLDATIYQVEVGSKLYGLKDENSDQDMLCVFVPNDKMMNSAIYRQMNHQFQYKDKHRNIDYIFTDIFTFIQNLLNGDSSINFEAIHDVSICEGALEFLYDMKEEFYTYKVIKGYLGKIKKDLDNMYKYGKDNRGYNKKLIHAYRGLMTVEKIKSGEYENVLTDVELGMCQGIKSLELNKDRKTLVDAIRLRAQDARDSLNRRLESKDVDFYLNVDAQIKLDEKLLKFSLSHWFNKKKPRIFDMKLVYNAMENGITY